MITALMEDGLSPSALQTDNIFFGEIKMEIVVSVARGQKNSQ